MASSQRGVSFSLPSRHAVETCSTPQDNFNPLHHQLEIGAAQFPGAIGELALIEAHNLRRISDGISREASSFGSQEYVPRRIRIGEIAGQRYAHNSSDLAPIQIVNLN